MPDKKPPPSHIVECLEWMRATQKGQKEASVYFARPYSTVKSWVQRHWRQMFGDDPIPISVRTTRPRAQEDPGTGFQSRGGGEDDPRRGDPSSSASASDSEKTHPNRAGAQPPTRAEILRRKKIREGRGDLIGRFGEPGTMAAIDRGFKVGVPLRVIAGAAGIDPDTLGNWIQRGRLAREKALSSQHGVNLLDETEYAFLEFLSRCESHRNRSVIEATEALKAGYGPQRKLEIDPATQKPKRIVVEPGKHQAAEAYLRAQVPEQYGRHVEQRLVGHDGGPARVDVGVQVNLALEQFAANVQAMSVDQLAALAGTTESEIINAAWEDEDDDGDNGAGGGGNGTPGGPLVPAGPGASEAH